MRPKKMTRNRWLGLILFLIYLFSLFYLMFFADLESRGINAKSAYTYNFVPFREIRRYLFHVSQIGMQGVLLNLVGNVLGFMPLGFVLPVFSRRCRKYWYNTVILAYLLSFFIEMVQLVFRAGSCDVDDMILNTIGGLFGYIFFVLVQKHRSARRKRERRTDGR